MKLTNLFIDGFRSFLVFGFSTKEVWEITCVLAGVELVVTSCWEVAYFLSRWIKLLNLFLNFFFTLTLKFENLSLNQVLLKINLLSPMPFRSMTYFQQFILLYLRKRININSTLRNLNSFRKKNLWNKCNGVIFAPLTMFKYLRYDPRILWIKIIDCT